MINKMNQYSKNTTPCEDCGKPTSSELGVCYRCETKSPYSKGFNPIKSGSPEGSPVVVVRR